MALWLTEILFAEYLVIMVACIAQKKWELAAYFLGSAILTLGVLGMNK